MKHNKLFVGVHYAMTLVFVISLVLWIVRLFHISNPTWALIPAVICTELDSKKVSGLKAGVF